MSTCPTCHGTGVISDYRIVNYRLPSAHVEVILQQRNTVDNWSTIIVASSTSDIARYCMNRSMKYPEKTRWINYPENPEGE